MTNTALFTRISNLPHPLQKEVLDYIEFIILKYSKPEMKKHPKAGCMQGTFSLSTDFNEPLEDFNEYMKWK